MIDNYVTGTQIRTLRENKKLTQEQLAAALDISVIELLSGSCIRNQNKNANIAKSKFYVCPVCGNVITSTGEAVISCCGITLPSQTPEGPAQARFKISRVKKLLAYCNKDGLFEQQKCHP